MFQRNLVPSYLVFLLSVRRLLVTASVVPSSPILVTLIMEELSSSKTSVLTRTTRRNFPKEVVLHSHRSGNLKSYIGWFLGKPPELYGERWSDVGTRVVILSLARTHMNTALKYTTISPCWIFQTSTYVSLNKFQYLSILNNLYWWYIIVKCQNLCCPVWLIICFYCYYYCY
jgi:hypothetical protein